ncbi:MAG: PhzF family phenazine biosynthesis isomerase [Cyclobacteriaceae bacterium]
MACNINTYIVDSFTSEPFKGNPAGVCLIEKEPSDALMLNIAKELGLSETAFVNELGAGHYGIRYFSPKMEIPLCGHATLASAKVLFHNHPELAQISFITAEQLDLQIGREGEAIIMEFPVYQTESSEAPPALLQALGIPDILNAVYNQETKILLLEIDSCSLLRSLSPDFPSLIQSHDQINGVLVTARSDEEAYDFESRYFWPWSGTDEDPVTGGTHTFLAKYWGDRLGKQEMMSFQCSERTGSMVVSLTDKNSVLIKGEACIVLEGRLASV